MSRSKPRIRRPTQARSKATVAAILEAAAQVLRAEGLEGTTTARIAERAGVSVGTLYQYFTDKDAIYEVLGEELLARIEARSTEYLLQIPVGGALDEVLPALIDGLIGVHTVDPVLHQQLARHEVMNGLTQIQAFQDREVLRVEAALRAGAGVVRDADPALVAEVLILAFGGIVARWARDRPERLADPAVRAELSRLVLGYLRPHP